MVRSDLPTVVCPECGADNNSFANACWICRHPLYAGQEDLVEAELAPQLGPPRQSGTARFMAIWAFVLLSMAVALIGLGIMVDEPQTLIPYCLISVPLVVVVAALMFKGNQSQNGALQTLSIVVSTIIVTIGTMVLLLIASVIALFAFCMMLFAR